MDDDDEAVGGFDFTAGEGTFSQDDYTMQPDSSLNNTTLMGDKLVSQPNKVILCLFDFKDFYIPLVKGTCILLINL